MAARARGLTLSRRSLLALGAGIPLLAGCGGEEPVARVPPSPPAGGARRIRYGDDHRDQFADLRLPEEDPAGTVVLLHGGYWRPEFGLDQLDPMAERFTGLGLATWNVEYRRTGAGGGVPATLEDVAAAMDRLAGPGLPSGLSRNVVVIGHSAGGHLATWVASRTSATPGGPPSFPLTGSISLAGVLDLTRAATRPGSSEPVSAFVGGGPDEVPDRYAIADPALLVPANCPVWAVHAVDDTVVPAEQSKRYLAAATAAKGVAERVLVPGDHLSIIDPEAEAFRTVRNLVREIQAPGAD